MMTYTCNCGARYKLPDGSGGKRAKCPKCGATFTIPLDEDTIPLAPLVDGDYGYFPKGNALPPAGPGVPDSEPGAGLADVDRFVALGRAAVAETRPRRGFWADVAWTFVLFIDPANLSVLVVLVVAYAAIALFERFCFAGILVLVIYGWLCSYWFNVITEAAAGEESLPRMGGSEGVLEEIVFPLGRFLGATVVASLPFVVYYIIARCRNIPVSATPTAPAEIVTLGLSMFLWPMVMLVVAIGGFCALLRVDLILATIGRTFLPYLAISLLVGGTMALHGRADALANSLFTGKGSALPAAVVTAVLRAYLSLVSMRIVGLYYHHFKSRFAWSWG